MRFLSRLKAQYLTSVVVALLQRTPIVRFAGLAEEVLGWSAVTHVLRAAVGAATLGAIDSIAGATYVVSTSGSSATVVAGSPITPVVFLLNNQSDIQPESWLVQGQFPPGLSIGDESGSPSISGVGSFDYNTSTPLKYYGEAFLTGTPTTPGVYVMQITAFQYPGNRLPSTQPFTFTLTVTPSPMGFSSQPISQTITSGSTVVLSAVATGTPTPTYQWYLGNTAVLNGATVSGATGPRLVITGATTANAGTYKVVATNSSGSATSNGATVTVAATNDPGRMTNISVLGYSGAAAQALTIGFVNGPPPPASTSPQSLLIRGIGPALAAFNVNGYLTDTSLAVYSQSPNVQIASNTHWAATVANQNAVTAAQTASGAGLKLTDPSSFDSALAQSLSAGGYTAIISGPGGLTGQTLAEVYDASPSYSATAPHLINISARAQVGPPAASVLTAGFIINGSSSKTVLIRGIGPALTAFGVPGALADPVVTLHQNVNNTDTILASNAGWGGDAQITAADTAVYAFALNDPGSKDSAVLITLPPGSYTAQVSSASGASGIALVEVYEVP